MKPRRCGGSDGEAVGARRYHAALIAAVALLVGGCGGSSSTTTIDQANLQTAIAVSIALQKHELSIVECPKHVVASRGVKFTCTATLASGRQVPFTVTGLDAKGNVHYGGFALAASSSTTASSTTASASTAQPGKKTKK